MFDIDHFKKINDTHGHEVGDVVLRGVAQEAAKTSAIVGRLGGEEFSILIEGSLQDGAALAENLRRIITWTELGQRQASLTVTCSFGVSAWEAGDTIDRLLRRADIALYDAKLAGRNRVVVGDARAAGRHRDDRQGLVRSADRRGPR